MVGARAFACVAITPKEAANDPLLARVATAPSLCLVDADDRLTAVLSGARLSGADAWSAMVAGAADFYAESLADAVRTTREAWSELELVGKERDALRGVVLDPTESAQRVAALDERERLARSRERGAWPLHPKSA